MSRRRLILATALAPLALPIMYVVIDIASGQSSTPSWSLIIGGYIAVFGYIGMIVFGLPIYFILKRANLLNLFTLLATGAAVGVLVIFFAGETLGRLLDSTASFNLISVVWGALSGLIVAFSFSVIAGVRIRGRNLEDA